MFTVHSNSPVVKLNELFYQRQADPCPFNLVCFIDSVEAIENVREMFRGDPLAGV